MKFKILPFEIIENICDFLVAKDIDKCNLIFSQESIQKVVGRRIQHLTNKINSYIKEYKMDKKLLNYTHNHETTLLHNLEHTHIYCLIFISQLYNYPVMKISNTEYIIDTTYKKRKVEEIAVISSYWLSNALIHYDSQFAVNEKKSKSNTIKIRRGSNTFKPDININTDLFCTHYCISPKVCKFIPILLWNQLKAYYPLSQTILYEEFLIRNSICFECKLNHINIKKTKENKPSLYYGKASQNLMIDYY